MQPPRHHPTRNHAALRVIIQPRSPPCHHRSRPLSMIVTLDLARPRPGLSDRVPSCVAQSLSTFGLAQTTSMQGRPHALEIEFGKQARAQEQRLPWSSRLQSRGADPKGDPSDHACREPEDALVSLVLLLQAREEAADVGTSARDHPYVTHDRNPLLAAR